MKKIRKFRIREKDVMNSLKVITAAGGQNSVTQMIGSLYDAIEDHYGIFASRLYRAFRPKPLKSTATSSWRKMCCLPYAYIYMVCNKYDPQRHGYFCACLKTSWNYGDKYAKY